MNPAKWKRFTAFAGTRRIAAGNLAEVATKAKELLDQDEGSSILIFDDETAEPIEVDFRGSVEEVSARYARGGRHKCDERRGPGRPKLGVVAREVTLLPRHWNWLTSQPGGASVALRKLVEEARRSNGGQDRARLAREAAYRFITALAGNLPGYEEANRALFAADRQRFHEQTDPWPAHVRDHARMLAAPSFPDTFGP